MGLMLRPVLSGVAQRWVFCIRAASSAGQHPLECRSGSSQSECRTSGVVLVWRLCIHAASGDFRVHARGVTPGLQRVRRGTQPKRAENR